MNRGGSWNNDADNARVAYRNNNHPDNRNNNLGFRVAFVPQHEGIGRMASNGQAVVPFPRKGIKTSSATTAAPMPAASRVCRIAASNVAGIFVRERL